MNFWLAALYLGSIVGVATASEWGNNNITIQKRDSSFGYAPTTVECPSDRPSLRDSLALSSQERAWLKKRRTNTMAATRNLLARLKIAGFDSDSYFRGDGQSDFPNIAVAVSGGGYRALLNGAGAIAAFDNRTKGSIGGGQIGGILQSATYFSGLSGGGWLVSSLYGNDFPTIEELLKTEGPAPLWQFNSPLWEGPDLGFTGTSNGEKYFSQIIGQVQSKIDAGFNTSITDIWGRALAYQLFDTSTVNKSHTFSSIQDNSKFTSGTLPMPILVADSRDEGKIYLHPTNTTNYEFNPWEMGSFDNIGFAPLRFVGSNFSAGKIPSSEQCVKGYDQFSFVYGTSSSLFNQIILQMDNSDMVPDIVKGLLTNFLKQLGNASNDIADWSPNPFHGWKPETNPSAHSKRLTLVDGGEDLQNIPFTPLIRPIRHVDVIFAVDSSADTLDKGGMNWPNGTAMVATYERSLAQENGTTFPPVPDVNTFLNLGLNSRPTMFGCDAHNLSFKSTAPLVVYLPNAPYVYNSNVSTFTMQYPTDQRNTIVQNGYNVVTMGNGTVDSEWPTCIGCAIMARSWNRTGTALPDVCNTCFDRYCWNGTVDSNKPAPYQPTTRLSAIKLQSAAAHAGSAASISMFYGVIMVIVLMMASAA
ncbi:lysophospholipase-like protein [Pyrenochaeta sp. MPI-SDFR-AT-0127]|nr:lysophospholipase-like protein [Pyrenochaeta sp. MPI-SDFR-AT-0127]